MSADGRREIAMLIGLPGAGKSTFFRERLAATHAHVSRDLFPGHRKPSERQAREIREALTAGQSVAVDNTNVSPDERRRIFEVARELGALVIGYWLDTSVAESRERNEQREGKARVPVVAIYAAAKRFVPPVYGEGFSELYRVRVAEGEFEVTRL